MNIDWSQVSAWAALAASITAIAALWYQIRQTRFTLGLEYLWRTEQEFRGTEMLHARQRAAEKLLRGEYAPELDSILDFLETIGLLLHKKVLDKEMVWNNYYSRSVGYWFTANARVTEVRQDDPAIWMEVEYLADTLMKIESKKAKKSLDEIKPTQEWLHEFLIEESQLVS